ncbi:clathrin heavy chain 2-like [Lampetra fluviatilis]
MAGEPETSSPISVLQLVQLTELGIPSEQVSCARVSLGVDGTVCARHTDAAAPHRSRVSLVDPRRPAERRSWPVGHVDSAVANPCRPLVALRAGTLVQVFDVESERLVSQCRVMQGVEFWVWLDRDTLCLVTDAAVLHWAVQREVEPEEVFSRHAKLRGAELVGYRGDPAGQWLALTGLYLDRTGCVQGLTQLYSRHTRLDQVIEAQAVALAELALSANPGPSVLLVAAQRRGAGHKGKVHVVELGPHRQGNSALTSHSDSLLFPLTEARDFPVSVQVLCRQGLVLVLSKYGLLFVADADTAAVLCCQRIGTHTVFASVPDPHTHGILGVSRSGQVLSLCVREAALLRCVPPHAPRSTILRRLLDSRRDSSRKITAV